MNSSPPAPFSSTYSPAVPELIRQLGCSLAISTYQAGKLIIISALNNEKLIQLPRNFEKAMGIALNGDQLALAVKDEIILFSNSPELGIAYPKNPGVYDSFFTPRVSYHTGQVDIHDIHYSKKGLIAVNTSFSCLCKIDEHFSFTPIWKPSFITELQPDDRCHLNGLAMKNGEPIYISTLGTGNESQSWRTNLSSGGALVDIAKNEFVLDGLGMPHSPLIINNKVYFLESALGLLSCFNPATGEKEVLKDLNGFVRGMAHYNGYLFIGKSKLRKNSSAFKDLPISSKSNEAAIVILHVETNAFVGKIKYEASVDEIYDVQVLPGLLRPGILNTIAPAYKKSLHLPGSTYWAEL